MKRIKWSHDGPPPEAYSRITNPERFAPLHDVALAQLEQLRTRFDVEYVEGYAIDPNMNRGDLARPGIKLLPSDSTSAPLFVGFTEFPGLMVRCGHFLDERFPACGCDACDETTEDELQRLTDLIDAVVGGRFLEKIRIPLLGAAVHEWEFTSLVQRRAGGSRIARSSVRPLVKGRTRTFEWSAWPLRKNLE